VVTQATDRLWAIWGRMRTLFWALPFAQAVMMDQLRGKQNSISPGHEVSVVVAADGTMATSSLAEVGDVQAPTLSESIAAAEGEVKAAASAAAEGIDVPSAAPSLLFATGTSMRIHFIARIAPVGLL